MTPVGALLTAIGLLASLVARRGIAAPAKLGGVAEQLRRLFTLIALLLALRLAWFAWETPLVVALVMVVASWLPLAVLRLGEELVRRHAPRPLKFAALGGAIGFSVLAATFGLVWTSAAVAALAVFQVMVVTAVVVHLYWQRGSVALAERSTANLLALALLLSVPLLASDFQMLFPGLPIRGGAFAALIFVLACSRLVTAGSRPMALLGDIAIAAGASGLAALAAHLAGAAATAIIAVSACAGASAALLLLVERFDAVGRTAGGILPDLARAETSRAAILAAHPLLASAQSLSEADLADFPAGTVEQLARFRVVTSESMAADHTLRDAARELLDRYTATHLLRLSQQPVRFLAICGGALTEEKLTAELEIVARLLERSE